MIMNTTGTGGPSRSGRHRVAEFTRMRIRVRKMPDHMRLCSPPRGTFAAADLRETRRHHRDRSSSQTATALAAAEARWGRSLASSRGSAPFFTPGIDRISPSNIASSAACAGSATPIVMIWNGSGCGGGGAPSSGSSVSPSRYAGVVPSTRASLAMWVVPRDSPWMSFQTVACEITDATRQFRLAYREGAHTRGKSFAR